MKNKDDGTGQNFEDVRSEKKDNILLDKQSIVDFIDDISSIIADEIMHDIKEKKFV